MEEEFKINITEDAAQEIKSIMETHSDVELCVRLHVTAGGCAGYKYHLGLEEFIPEIEDVVLGDEIKVVVNPDLLKLVNGSEIDYVKDQNGFKVTNPNMKKGCGCGQSFSVGGDPEGSNGCGSCGNF
jgi:iron-sulfur cluster assembly accessory protein